MIIGTTLVDVVNHWATTQPEHRAYTFLNAQGEEVDHISYGELRRKARAVATQLSHRDIHSRNAILMYPAGINYMVGFLGCIYAGVAPAPVHAPKRNRSNRKIIEIIKHADAAALLSDRQTLDELEQIKQQEQGWPLDITCLATNTLDSQHDNLNLPTVPAEAVAFLQFTSGSTSMPKGVMITHRNCLYNLRMMQTVHQASPASVFVSWLPHYHDLGLVTHLLGNLYCGSHCVLLAPTTFLFQPVQWLRAITNYQAHHTGAPNFAYRLCTDRISEQDKRGLDLSSLKMAINAAEPVDSQTIIDFTARFADVGFKSNTFLPAYGMAEATVFITSRELKDEPVLKHCDWDTLINKKIATPPTAGAKTKTFVGCGVTWLEQDIRIVDPASGIEVPTNHIGEIWISGPNIMVGYYNNEQATAETFAYLPDSDRKYLRTGDLGFIDETGELYIAGRLKDMIIINGVNYYPQDIEAVIEKAHADIRPGCDGRLQRNPGRQ